MRTDNIGWAERLSFHSWEVAKMADLSKAHAFGKTIARWADLKSESGVTALEYGLLAGLIAVVIISAVTVLGTTLSATFTHVSTSMP